MRRKAAVSSLPLGEVSHDLVDPWGDEAFWARVEPPPDPEDPLSYPDDWTLWAAEVDRYSDEAAAARQAGLRAVEAGELPGRAGRVVEQWHNLVEDLVVNQDTAGLLRVVAEMTRLRSMVAAVEVRAATGFDALVRHEQLRAGVAADRIGKGVDQDLALARRDSPGRTGLFVASARTTVRDLPGVLARLRAGEANPEAVAAVASQVSVLSREHRGMVDEAIAERIGSMSRRQAEGVSRAMADQLDPQAAVRRRRRRRSERRVTVRPAPDDMAYLTALLPMKQAIAIKAKLTEAAKAVIAEGDAARCEPCGEPGCDPDVVSGSGSAGHRRKRRTRAQIEADLFVEYLTGQATPDATALLLNVLVPAETLAGGDAPARVSLGGTGVGVTGEVGIPAEELRAHVAEAARYGVRHAIRAVGVSPDGVPVSLTRSRPLPDRLLELIRATISPDHTRLPAKQPPPDEDDEPESGGPRGPDGHGNRTGPGDQSGPDDRGDRSDPAQPGSAGLLFSHLHARLRTIAQLDSAIDRQTRIDDLLAELTGAGARGPSEPGTRDAGEVRARIRETVLTWGRIIDGRDTEARVAEVVRLLSQQTTRAQGDDGSGPFAGELLEFLVPTATVDSTTQRASRFATGSIRDLVLLRDQTCRTPYCDAPIRDIDHINPAAARGRTEPDNLQGLCQACNLTKDLPTRYRRARPGNADSQVPHSSR